MIHHSMRSISQCLFWRSCGRSAPLLHQQLEVRDVAAPGYKLGSCTGVAAGAGVLAVGLVLACVWVVTVLLAA